MLLALAASDAWARLELRPIENRTHCASANSIQTKNREEWFAKSAGRIVKIATGRRRGLGDHDERDDLRREPTPKSEVLAPFSSQHRRTTKTGLHHWPPERDGRSWRVLQLGAGGQRRTLSFVLSDYGLPC